MISIILSMHFLSFNKYINKDQTYHISMSKRFTLAIDSVSIACCYVYMCIGAKSLNIFNTGIGSHFKLIT